MRGAEMALKERRYQIVSCGTKVFFSSIRVALPFTVNESVVSFDCE